MRKSEMLNRAYYEMAKTANLEETIDMLIAEGMLMPPCNKYGHYDWEDEDVNALNACEPEPAD